MRIIKSIYFRTIRPFNWISFYRKRLFNFILPNLRKIIQKKVTFDYYPICHQKTLITGAGNVSIGQKCVFGYKLGGHFYCGFVEIQVRYNNSRIVIGNNVLTNNNLFFCAANHIEIGDNTLIGEGVMITDHEAHGMAPDKRSNLGEIGKVVIGRNVWLGNDVSILKNSEIGENTIVAAGAVVSGKFPANVIIGGVPAKIISEL